LNSFFNSFNDKILRIKILVIFFIFFLLLMRGYVSAEDSFEARRRFKFGKDEFSKGNYEKAVKEFEESLKADSSLIDARYLMAICYYQMSLKSDKEKNTKRALEELEKIIKKEVKYEGAYVYTAKIYSDQKQYDKAEEVLKKLTSLGFSSRGYYALGSLYYQKGDIDKAVDYWKRSVEMGSKYLPAYFNLSVVCYNKNELTKALEYINRALRQDMDSYRYFKGKILLKMDKVSQAKEEFSKVMHVFKDSEYASYSKVQMLILEKKYSEAVKLLAGKEDDEAFFLKAYLLYKEGKYSDAKDILSGLLSNDPNNKDVIELLDEISKKK